MTDIVDELRARALQGRFNLEAADEIERLRAELSEQEPARLVTATAYRWRYRGAVKWQYGELTEETARLAKEHNHEVQPLYALPGAQPAPSAQDDVMRGHVMDAVAKALGDAYDCTRVWSAWGYGTMGSDDFRLVANDPHRLHEIAEAAIQAVFAAALKPEEAK